MPITLIGHPFAPIGMGEQLRSHVMALTGLHLRHRVLDIFRHAARGDPVHHAVMGEREITALPAGIRIFHVNGDEIATVTEAVRAGGGRFEDGYNIIVPAWELPVYPKEWAAALAAFDEVWALSTFIRDSLAASGVASHVVGQAVELPAGPLLPRRYFGLRESAFVLLHAFDLSSYAARKNPEAVLALFRRLRGARPFDDVQLVLKVKHLESDAADWAATIPPDPMITVLSRPLDSLAMRGLIAACDCCVSLHRAEGFGRGLGEAMMLGRLAMGTGWSGNTDFMTDDNSLLVRARQVRVPRGAYPHGQGQGWAEPDLDHAEALLRRVLDDPAHGRAVARRGAAEVLRTHGPRAVGLRMLARLEAVAAGMAPARLPPRRRSARLKAPA